MLRQRSVTQNDATSTSDDGDMRTNRRIEREKNNSIHMQQVTEATFAIRIHFCTAFVVIMMTLGHSMITGMIWWPVLMPGTITPAVHCTALWLLGPSRCSQIYLAFLILPAFVITPLCLAMPSKEFVTMHEEAKDAAGTLAIFFFVGVGLTVNQRSTTWKVLGVACFVGSRLAGELLLARAHSYESFTRFYVMHAHLPFVAGAMFGQLLTYTLVAMTSPLHASLREAELRNGELEQARQHALIREFQRSMSIPMASRGDDDFSQDSSNDRSDHDSHYTAKIMSAGNFVAE